MVDLDDARERFVPNEDDPGPGLLGRIGSLLGQVGRATNVPTEPQMAWSDRYAEELTEGLRAHASVLDRVASFTRSLDALGLGFVEP